MTVRISPRKRLFLLVSLLATVSLILGYTRLTAVPDPLYKGRPLSAYMWAAGPTLTGLISSPEVAELQKAVVATGTNTLPLLRAWLLSDPSAWRVALQDFVARFPLLYSRPVRKRALAARAAAYLGNQATPLLPILMDGLTNVDRLTMASSWMALYKCVEGAKAEEDVLSALLARQVAINRDFPDQLLRDIVANTIEVYDPAASLRHLMVIQAGREPEAMHSARILSRRQRFAERVIPYLHSTLSSTNSATLEGALLALADYGPEPQNSVAPITNFLDHSEQSVQSAARQALLRINRNTE